MVLDRLENMDAYRTLGDGFAKAIDYLKGIDVLQMPISEFTIDECAVYGFIKEKQLTKENEKWEVHRRYADIQLVLGGSERMGFQPYTNQPVSEPYNPDKDVELFVGNVGSELILNPGDFAIFFPGELHRPDCPTAKGPLSRKMVIKVLIP